MSWEDASPVFKIIHNCKAGIDIGADGRAKLNLSFSDPFFREMGEPKKMLIQAGKGENLGKLRLVPKDDGTVEVRALEKGGARAQILLPEGIPARIREIEPGEVLERPSKEELRAAGGEAAWIIALPLAAWEQQVAPKPTGSSEQPRQQTTAPAAVPAKVSKKLDAVTYLNAKGVKTARLAGDWYQMAGNRVAKTAVLAEVNKHRKAAELPLVMLDEID